MGRSGSGGGQTGMAGWAATDAEGGGLPAHQGSRKASGRIHFPRTALYLAGHTLRIKAGTVTQRDGSSMLILFDTEDPSLALLIA